MFLLAVAVLGIVATATRMYLLPLALSDSGPRMSTATNCIGLPTLILWSGRLDFGAGVFLAAQVAQVLHHN